MQLIDIIHGNSDDICACVGLCMCLCIGFVATVVFVILCPYGVMLLMLQCLSVMDILIGPCGFAIENW